MMLEDQQQTLEIQHVKNKRRKEHVQQNNVYGLNHVKT